MAESNYYRLDNVHIAVPVLINNFLRIFSFCPLYSGWILLILLPACQLSLNKHTAITDLGQCRLSSNYSVTSSHTTITAKSWTLKSLSAGQPSGHSSVPILITLLVENISIFCNSIIYILMHLLL